MLKTGGLCLFITGNYTWSYTIIPFFLSIVGEKGQISVFLLAASVCQLECSERIMQGSWSEWTSVDAGRHVRLSRPIGSSSASQMWPLSISAATEALYAINTWFIKAGKNWLFNTEREMNRWFGSHLPENAEIRPESVTKCRIGGNRWYFKGF